MESFTKFMSYNVIGLTRYVRKVAQNQADLQCSVTTLIAAFNTLNLHQNQSDSRRLNDGDTAGTAVMRETGQIPVELPLKSMEDFRRLEMALRQQNGIRSIIVSFFFDFSSWQKRVA